MKIGRASAALAALFLLQELSRAQSSPKPFTPEDMLGVVEFVPGTGPVISAEGGWIAYATADPGLESNILARHPDSFLWVVRPGGNPARIAPGDYADTPVWSPNGKHLAFYRNHAGRRQLCIWTAETNSVREMGDFFPKDVSLWSSDAYAPKWAADGTIVYPILTPSPTQPDPESLLVHSTDAVVPGDMPFTDWRKWTLAAVDVKSGHSRLLNPEPVPLTRFAISPDGNFVLFRAIQPETLALFRQQKSQDWIVPMVNREAPHAVLEGRSPAWVIFSGDSKRLLFPERGKLRSINFTGGNDEIVSEDFPERSRDPQESSSGWLAVLAARPGTGPHDTKMYSILEPVWDVVVAKPGERKPRNLTEEEKNTQNSNLVWTTDGKSLFFHSENQQTYRESIRRWRPGGAAGETIYAADRAIRFLDASQDGSKLVFGAMSSKAPEDGYLLEDGQAEPRRITDLNPQLATFHFEDPRVIHYFSADGDPLEGLLYLPRGTNAEHRVPVVTYVYEKLSPSKNHFNAEAQWHVSHGYGYLMPDVLIKDGYTGDSFVKCVVPAVNAVRGIDLTTGKFGITGGSFGGYAGLFLISHSDIFAAAVLRAPPSDFFSTWGDGRDRDIWTIETGQARTSGTPWSNRRGYIENSPFFEADQIHTPVLIVHGKADFTVPFQQGIMMFSALRALHRTADFLIYRDAEHSIVRGSRFRFLDFHGHTMDWWDRFLRGGTDGRHT